MKKEIKNLLESLDVIEARVSSQKHRVESLLLAKKAQRIPKENPLMLALEARARFLRHEEEMLREAFHGVREQAQRILCLESLEEPKREA